MLRLIKRRKQYIVFLTLILISSISVIAQSSECDKCKITKIKSNHRKIYTEVIINAPKNEVWKILTNFSEMSNWSTGLQKVEGEIKNGGNAIAYFRNPKGEINGYEKDSLIYKKGEFFGWKSPFILGITDNHLYKVYPLENGTKFIHTDECIGGGIGAFFFRKKITKTLLRNMIKFNEELKVEAENKQK